MARNIVVTGATGDIGRAVVDTALKRGHRVIASVRKLEYADTFPSSDRLSFVRMSADDRALVSAAFNEIDNKLAGETIDAVIHTAAIQEPQPIELLSLEDFQRIMMVNAGGSLAVLQESIPRVRGTGGNIVLSSSLWGRVSGPMVGPYAASKWALEALVDAARRETLGTGFNIVLAEIGAVISKMLSGHNEALDDQISTLSAEHKALYEHVYRHNTDMVNKLDSKAISVEKVAAKLVDIAEHPSPKPRYRIGLDAKVLCTLARVLPTRAMDRLLGTPTQR